MAVTATATYHAPLAAAKRDRKALAAGVRPRPLARKFTSTLCKGNCDEQANSGSRQATEPNAARRSASAESANQSSRIVATANGIRQATASRHRSGQTTARQCPWRQRSKEHCIVRPVAPKPQPPKSKVSIRLLLICRNPDFGSFEKPLRRFFRIQGYRHTQPIIVR